MRFDNSMNTYYCSRRHQKEDWKYVHRAYCKEVQSSHESRRQRTVHRMFIDSLKGFCLATSPQDAAFIKSYIRQYAHANTRQIHTFMADHSLATVTLAFDFNVVPEKVIVNHVSPICPLQEKGPGMNHDITQEKWTCLVQQQRNLNAPPTPTEALICASIPIGNRSQVIMGALYIPRLAIG